MIVSNFDALPSTEDLARLGRPLVHDAKHGLWSVGPPSGARALSSARMPELILPDLEGRPFDIASLMGKKVLLIAWASW